MDEKLEYQRVAALIERQIGAGTLRPADRIPSVRAMSRDAGVSVGTVVQAYLQLERRGLLEPKARSGYFVAAQQAPRLVSPATREAPSRRPLGVATEVVDTVIQSLTRTDLVALNSAVASSAGRINGRLNALTRRALREFPGLPNSFSTPPGHAALRREIAKRCALQGMLVEADDVVITNGTMEAVALALGVLCSAGDTVLVESPTYFGILQLLQHLRLKVVEVRNHPGTGIDVAGLEYALEGTKVAAALLQSSINNPTGAVTPDAVKPRILAALAKHGVPLIEDDIYGELYFGAERPRPFAAFAPSIDVVTCSSISKSVALGFRLGWAISARHTSALARAKFCTSVGSATLQQDVAARYFAAQVHDRHVRRVRDNLRGNCAQFIEAVARHFPAGTCVASPAGGVVLWVELPQGVDGVRLFHSALERGIGIAPGIIFSASAEYRGFIRLSAGVQWTPAVDKALKVLGRLAGG